MTAQTAFALDVIDRTLPVGVVAIALFFVIFAVFMVMAEWDARRARKRREIMDRVTHNPHPRPASQPDPYHDLGPSCGWAFVRASGESVCPRCGGKYFDHPMDEKDLSWDSEPYLHVLCDGTRVKL